MSLNKAISLLVLLTSGQFTAVCADSIAEVQSADGSHTLYLTGMGMAKQNHQDFFLAALYQSVNTRSVQGALMPNNAKRMEMRVVMETLSSKKFVRFWGQQVRMNNEPSLIDQEEKEITRFLSFFRSRIRAGDRIVVEYTPGKGSTVLFNNDALGTIESAGFMRVLLNAWLGPRPPTEQFKQGVLGNNSDAQALELLARYRALSNSTGDQVASANGE